MMKMRENEEDQEENEGDVEDETPWQQEVELRNSEEDHDDDMGLTKEVWMTDRVEELFRQEVED